MKTSNLTIAACCLALSALAIALPAHAYDLTGSWVGKWKCSGFDGEKFTSDNKTSALSISQVGGTVNAVIDPSQGAFSYNGGAIPDAAKPEKGELVLVSCGADNKPLVGAEHELVRFKVKTKTGTFKATLSGVSLFEDNQGGVATCKYSYKRTDTVDPGVSACP